MNKQNAISKINKVGKIGHVISIIAIVLSSIVTLALTIALIVLLVLPKDFVSVSTSGQIDANINLKQLGVLAESDYDNIITSINESTNSGGELSVDGISAKISAASIDDGVLKVSTDTEVSSFTLSRLVPVVLSALIYSICTIVVIVFIAKLCKAFKTCSSPFDASIINTLRKVAFSLIPMAILDSITNSCADMIKGANDFNLSINIFVVLAILLILGLAFIFKYGAVLQEESDETL